MCVLKEMDLQHCEESLRRICTCGTEIAMPSQISVLQPPVVESRQATAADGSIQAEAKTLGGESKKAEASHWRTGDRIKDQEIQKTLLF